MSFNVDDIVRRIAHTQKYKVVEVQPENTLNKVCLEPNTAPDMFMWYHDAELELVP